MNVMQVFGQVGIGHLSDRMNFHLPMFGSTMCSALAIFLLWGFSNGFGQLLAFSLIYGLLAGLISSSLVSMSVD
jgi:MFS family permease